MNIIKIQGTDDIPTVVLDAENEIYQFSGRSLPEDVLIFTNLFWTGLILLWKVIKIR